MSADVPDHAMPDAPARLRALSELSSTLLVEAGAGTGKTSLLAGRVTMLLLTGVDPADVAAITFTEAAAGELAERVHLYVDQLLSGSIPKPLAPALPAGVDAPALARLGRAAARLDELTATTIHGFCQIILANYAVEADIDPGAQVVDEDVAKAIFERVFDSWLARRLSLDIAEDDPVLVLTRADPRGVVDLFRDIAAKRREHRTARAARPEDVVRPDLDLVEAIDSLKRWCLSATCQVPTFVTRSVEEFEALGAQFAGRFEPSPGFDQLWLLAHPERSPRMKHKELGLLELKTAEMWRKAAGDDAGAALEERFQALVADVDAAYRRMMSWIAASLAFKLSKELDEVLDDYAAAKRASAMLDFDDLLQCAVRMLRNHPSVRAALAARFRHLLVDEFQDTDPVQCDIIFRIAGSDHAATWETVPQRPGALFLVGDPKQSLFLFRGAAIDSYERAKAVIARAFPSNILPITANFRTVDDILAYVNRCFDGPFSEPGQPGYVALAATRRTKRHDAPCAAKVTVALLPNASISEVREAEAAAVAEACSRLVGGLDLKGADGSARKVGAGDIALLAPAGTELWIYERALQAIGLPFSSKAGKGFFRRQEVQDLVCLTRLLADPDDSLALGAFLRGPLVGFTDETLLDAAAALPQEPGQPFQGLTLRTPLDAITDPGLREILEVLLDIRRRVRAATPAQILLEAIERLAIRVVLTRRDPRRASAANANVDLFLQRASAYGVRGLRRFAQDITAAWSRGGNAAEGRVDSEGEAIDIVSIHSAKGLEWPIVIPINAASSPFPRGRIVHRMEDDTLHWTVGGVASPWLAEALRTEAQDLARERARLLYVCCTRAEDLLILPHVSQASETAYSRAVDLSFATLPELDLEGLTGAVARPDRGPANQQDEATFAAEIARIEQAARPILWLRPSDKDEDRASFEEDGDVASFEAMEMPEIVGGGRVRGLLLHKLIEEILWEGLAETQPAVMARAEALLPDLLALADDDAVPPDCAEVSATALSTLALPDIAALRPNLIPEVPVYGVVPDGGGEAALAGRADALAIEDGRISAVIDWKSDIAPDDHQRQQHVEQLRLYLAATGAPRGALVYSSLGRVRWVELPEAYAA